jgi:hypothetical protein
MGGWRLFMDEFVPDKNQAALAGGLIESFGKFFFRARG